ncbi:MAG: ECF transporter S component [Eubacteriales bacterium]|nr:ECF transporter S component [Eubacteriales bacterium]
MSTKKPLALQISLVAIMAALAFVSVLVIRIPAVMFLKYEPKDIILLLTGLIFSPATAIAATVVSCLIELITISSTGGLGFVMNVLASLAYVLPVCYFFAKKREHSMLLIGLAVGIVSMTGLMILWNYIVTPIFLQRPRAEIVPLLWSAILPFNLVKAAINSGVCLALYPILRRSLASYEWVESAGAVELGRRKTRYLYAIGVFLILTGILCIWAMRN